MLWRGRLWNWFKFFTIQKNMWGCHFRCHAIIHKKKLHFERLKKGDFSQSTNSNQIISNQVCNLKNYLKKRSTIINKKRSTCWSLRRKRFGNNWKRPGAGFESSFNTFSRPKFDGSTSGSENGSSCQGTIHILRNHQ